MAYSPTIGLEIHAELRTKLKMFCSCKNDPDEKRPNVNICPICMGHPGTLPVINKEAVKSILKIGMAVEGELADFSEFDRKNYFYPDIPKGYQISQYKHPLVSGGELAGVKLTRVHLEEDTARSTHEKGDYSLVDFNRAGVPLMELVTEPVIKDARGAARFGRELQLLLQYLGVAEANMEKGEMRVEANISVSDDSSMGTKVEVKNLNSFRAVERAIEYEVKRQVEVLERGEKVVQETRGWDENKQLTFSQREKEESHDYRYFPEPDLPKLRLSVVEEFAKKALAENLSETPDQKRRRYAKYALKDEDKEFFIDNRSLAQFFEETLENLSNENAIKKAANYIISDVAGLGGAGEMAPQSFAMLIQMIDNNQISSRGAKEILKIMVIEGGKPEAIAQKHNLIQESNEENLIKMASKIIEENLDPVRQYKEGKISALQYLVGQAMKETKGSANPQKLQEIFKKLLK